MSKIVNMRWVKFLTYTILFSFLWSSCDNTGDDKSKTDTLSSGEINIAVDETYKPIIEEELKVFRSSYPEANIHVSYKPESEVFKDYIDGKVRLILVTRPLT